MSKTDYRCKDCEWWKEYGMMCTKLYVHAGDLAKKCKHFKFKRATDFAADKYPFRYDAHGDVIDFEQTILLQGVCRIGYMQAEKDTLERVILWLKDNVNKYIVDIGVGYGENGRNVELIVGGKCWDDLKKAMEDDEQ